MPGSESGSRLPGSESGSSFGIGIEILGSGSKTWDRDRARIENEKNIVQEFPKIINNSFGCCVFYDKKNGV